MLSINTNQAAIQDLFYLGQAQNAVGSAMRRLSSGLRINSAADDPAGLAIAAKMTGQINGLDQATANAQNGVAMLSTADGALSQTQSIIQNIRTLAVQAANGTLTPSDRANLQATVDQLAAQLTSIAKQTQFNTLNLLNGSLQNVVLQVGANANQTISFTIGAMDAASLGLTSAILGGAGVSNFSSATIPVSSALSVGTTYTIQFDATNTQAVDLVLGGQVVAQATFTGPTVTPGTTLTFFDRTTATLVDSVLVAGATMVYTASGALGTLDYGGPNITTPTAAQAAIPAVDSANAVVLTQRGVVGAVVNRLQATISTLTVASQNLSIARGVIQDANIPQETMHLTQSQVLLQAGVAMLVQANTQPQALLRLITG